MIKNILDCMPNPHPDRLIWIEVDMERYIDINDFIVFFPLKQFNDCYVTGASTFTCQEFLGRITHAHFFDPSNRVDGFPRHCKFILRNGIWVKPFIFEEKLGILERQDESWWLL
jgi:hypothetical protein